MFLPVGKEEGAWSSAMVARGFLSVAGRAVQDFASFPSLRDPRHSFVSFFALIPLCLPCLCYKASCISTSAFSPTQEEAHGMSVFEDSRSCRTWGVVGAPWGLLEVCSHPGLSLCASVVL